MKVGRPNPGLDELLDAAPFGVVALDSAHRVVAANQPASTMLGSANLDGRALAELVGRTAFDALMEEGGGGPVVVTTDGRTLEITASKRVTGAVLMLQDVTERIREEVAQRESRRQLDRLAASLLDSQRSLDLALSAGSMGLWRWDEKTNCVSWNESLERLYGLEPRTFGGTFEAFLALVDPRDREFVIEEVSKAGQAGPDYQIRFRIVRPDGIQAMIADRGRVLFDREGRRIGITGVCWDCTEENANELERERLTSELKAAHALLDSLFDSAPVGLGFWDTDLRFVKVNRALADLNGMAPEDHVGKTVGELLPRVDPSVMEMFRAVVSSGEPVLNHEASGYTPASPDELRYWNLSYYPIRIERLDRRCWRGLRGHYESQTDRAATVGDVGTGNCGEVGGGVGGEAGGVPGGGGTRARLVARL